MPPISNDWLSPLKEEFGKEYYKKLYQTVNEEYKTHVIYPPADDLFNAFHFTPLHEVKVVILGQDPYHNEGQAHGLCFSVQKGVEIPPSLLNIYKELQDDLNCTMPSSGYLKKWADQGVLLLNTVLTVRAHEANSHKGIGWEEFTDAAIRALATEREHLVYMLWGGYARSKAYMIDKQKNLVLESVHPSPLSANRGGWFGQHQFSRCNAYLQENGIAPIQW